jgi:hypothetical protein
VVQVLECAQISLTEQRPVALAELAHSPVTASSVPGLFAGAIPA